MNKKKENQKFRFFFEPQNFSFKAIKYLNYRDLIMTSKGRKIKRTNSKLKINVVLVKF